jgi:hypothetical protein
MAGETSGNGLGAQPWSATSRTDPVFEVTGVAAAEVVRRCVQTRGSHGSAPRRAIRQRVPTARVSARSGWRLLDFADLGDGDFVRDAHRVLLGRGASPADVDRRLGELRAGSSRLEIVVRLALCPEGRRAARPPVRGIGLPALAATARLTEALKASPLLGASAGRGERAARSALARPIPVWPATLLAAGAAAVVLAVRRRRS